MEAVILYLVLGLGSGAIYASLALGLIVINRGTNVVNFGYAAMMMVSTLVYGSLRNNGVYLLPIPGVPGIELTDGPMNPALAALLAVLTTLVIAILADRLVFRRVRTAPVLARVAASVGVMVTLLALAILQYTSVASAPPGLLPDNTIELFDASVIADRLYLAVIVVVLAIGLWAFYRFTTIGLVMRACAENERATTLLGWSTDRISFITWTMGGLIAGIMGVLAAPIVSVDPTTYALLIIPVLGVALIGRFTSFTWCLVGGLGLGMAQSLIQRFATDVPWLPPVGVQEGLPFLVIIVVLALRGRVLTGRGALSEGRYPVAYAPRKVALRTAILVAVGVLAMVGLDGGLRYALITTLIGIVLALSLVVVTGYTGMISLAQFAFAGVAGFMLSKLADGLGIPFPLAPLLAAGAAGVLGLVIGFPALRFRGLSLAIITLAAGAAVFALVFQNPAITGAYAGAPIPPPELFGLDLSITAPGGESSIVFGLGCLLIVVIVALAVANLRRSGSGQRMLAVRANDRAAAAAGINVASVKLQAFGLSAFIAGIAGTMMSYQQPGGNLSFMGFSPTASILLLAAVFIGGVSTVVGAVIAGIATTGGLMAFIIIAEFPGYAGWEMLIGGIGMILVANLQPDGVAGFNIAAYRDLIRKRRDKRGAAAHDGSDRTPPTRVATHSQNPDTLTVGR